MQLSEQRLSKVQTSVNSEATATLVNKGGLLVVRAEPLTDLTDIVQQEREQRVAELMQQAGL